MILINKVTPYPVVGMDTEFDGLISAAGPTAERPTINQKLYQRTYIV